MSPPGFPRLRQCRRRAVHRARRFRRLAAWEQFRRKFVSPDGRVIDVGSDDDRTVSSQSYGLFFALVANDRASFDRLLHWTENNLAEGDLTAICRVAVGARSRNGKWGVLDSNGTSTPTCGSPMRCSKRGVSGTSAATRRSTRHCQARTRQENRARADARPHALARADGFSSRPICGASIRATRQFQVLRGLGSAGFRSALAGACRFVGAHACRLGAAGVFRPTGRSIARARAFCPIPRRMPRARTTQFACACGSAC